MSESEAKQSPEAPTKSVPTVSDIFGQAVWLMTQSLPTGTFSSPISNGW